MSMTPFDVEYEELLDQLHSEWEEEYLRRGEDGIEQFTFGDEWFPEGTFASLAVMGSRVRP